MPTRRLSLRLKLTAWFLLIYAAIEVSLGLGGMALRIDGLRDQFDQMLLEHARSVARQIDEQGMPWLRADLEAQSVFDSSRAFVGRFILQLRDRDGRVIAGPAADVAPAIPDSIVDRVRSEGEPVFVTIQSEERRADDGAAPSPFDEWRVLAIAIRGNGEESQYLVVGTTDRLLRESVQQAWLVFLIHVPIGFLAAWIAGWLIAGRAVAPFGRMAAAARDVSPNRLEERFHFESADNEISRLEEELNHALERIEAGYRAQERFISNIAHEIKTPVSVVLAQSQLMKSRDITDAERRQYVASVEEEMRRLGRLVESFLMLARAGHGKGMTTRQRVALRDVVVESMQECYPVARQYEVRLVPVIPEQVEDDDLTILGDGDLLRTMIDNLVRNAIRFSPPEQRVDVGLARVDEAAHISVRDFGEGIPEEHLDSIFDRFAQVPGGNSRTGGFGLGLAIAHNVAELHGGEIEVQNCEDGGCCFTVVLPLGDRTLDEAETEPPDECFSAE